jgi:hypothetical protein
VTDCKEKPMTRHCGAPRSGQATVGGLLPEEEGEAQLCRYL